jgi:PEGA domain
VIAILIAAPSTFVGGDGARAASDVAAAVVVVGDLPPDGALEAAREQVPGRWRVEPLKPEARPPVSPQADVELLSRAYLNADFLRCLTELQRPTLDLERLLEEGRRMDAAHVGTIAAACSLGAGDEGRAREIVRRLLVRELDEPDFLRKTTPDFQRMAEDERHVAQRLPRVTVEVRTEPPGASVEVDGAMRCQMSPCRLHLLRGEHVVVTDKLGQRRRSLTAMLDADQTLTVALDPAAADEIHRQLALTLGSGADPSGADIARAASTAYGVGLLALVWRKGGQVHANVFQRSGGGLTHVAMDATGPDPAARAVSTALREWRSETGPRSMLRQPLFWGTAVGVALASAVAVFFLVRPKEPRHDVLF